MPKNTPILEAEVAEYLKHHPDFFSKHPELLADINVPHQTGQAVSLVEKQMQVLRQSNKDLKARFTKLLEVARQNEIHFENTRQLVIELLDFQLRHGELEELLDIFDARFPSMLAANAYRLIILDDESEKDSSQILSISSQSLKESIPRCFEMEKTYLGSLSDKEKSLVFADQSELIASVAMVPLRFKQVNAILAIGNVKEGHFYKGMGTMFLDHIAACIARVLCDMKSENKRHSVAV